MRVGLVIPPSPFLLDERVFVSLGILKVAASLEAAGHRVSLLDLSGVQNYLEVFAGYMDGCADEVIGFTTTTPQLPSAMQLAGIAAARRPDIRRIVGGPHVTLIHSAANWNASRAAPRPAGRMRRWPICMPRSMCCGAGDGEIAVLRAIQPDSPALVDGDDRKGEYFMSDATYDATPLPARHMVDITSYHYSIEGHDATSLIAQLGCPFNCGFCGGRHSNSLRVTRTRSIESIVGELEMLHKTYGYNRVHAV